ncbi:hypothetical protein PO909_026369, partial [Leuciscus waleckii]
TLSYSSERDRHTRRQTTPAPLPQLLPTAESDWLRQDDSWTDVPEEAHMGGELSQTVSQTDPMESARSRLSEGQDEEKEL